MPKLWSETIQGHRSQVRDAVLDATARLVATQGLRDVTMSEIASQSGIGRATLYKYYPDVDAILLAWHQRQVAAHLEELARTAVRADTPLEALRSVLERYAAIRQQRSDRDHGGEPGETLHVGPAMEAPLRQLHGFVDGLIRRAVKAGDVRSDIPTGELASYCLGALGAAAELKSRAAVKRLVEVTLAGMLA